MRFYLDHNAATSADPRVLQRFVEVEQSHAANPSSVHAAGRAARAVVEESRARVAAALGVLPDEIVFLSGGTEANNLVVKGAGDLVLPVLLGEVEHPSVRAAAEPRGIVEFAIDDHGRIRPEVPSRPVGLVCLTHAQSETGAIQPVAAAADLARRLAAPLHVDASQTLGRIDLAEVLDRAQTVTLSAHKAGGLKGMTVLLARMAGGRPAPLLHGGGQEGGLRAGTQSPGLAAATALAVELAVREREARAHAMRLARDTLVAGIRTLAGAHLLTTEPALPNTALFWFADVDGRHLLPALDLAGIEASQGSACASGSPLPSATLLAMHLSEAQARASVRFSVSQHTSHSAAEQAARIVCSVVERLRRARNRV